ncbi:MAG: endopeptidase La [Candidatus Omnitrophota bacterium]|jgi:ATP-dependent Lon protease|nr:MAG: endopeptidase La [Candidatus Omnitrophota bacterium]
MQVVEQVKQDELEVPRWLPVVPLNNSVLFPGATVPIAVSNEETTKAVEIAIQGARFFVAVAIQRERTDADRSFDHLFHTGTAAFILRMMRGGENITQLVIRGMHKLRIKQFEERDGVPWAEVEVIPEEEEGGQSRTIQALMRQISEKAETLIQKSPLLPKELSGVPSSLDNPHRLAYMVLSLTRVDVPRLQEIYETASLEKLLRMTLKELAHELEIIDLGGKIQNEVQTKLSKNEREFYLREQLRAIRKELGEGEDQHVEVQELRDLLDQKVLPESVRGKAEKELKRLDNINPSSPEYPMSRNYLEWLLEFPWLEETKDIIDLKQAESILEEDHYGLNKVKDRILEFLSVRKLNPKIKGPILCFVGPPGVGKTSLGQSIARALGRKFVRLALGGVHDEAEIRGHRRTYVGALPGTIIQQIRRVGTINPVFMLDEIDKVGQSFRGDPSSALLEVLDPAQNHSFRDHYMEVDIDLSKVLFIATANVPDRIQPPLRDRMEEIRLAGYTTREKEQIALKYLIPRAVEENGLQTGDVNFAKGILEFLIAGYTREAGVRNLERELKSIGRKIAVRKIRGAWRKRKISKVIVREFLGAERFTGEVARRTSRPGVATGLAWTAVGGEILFVEALPVPGGKGVVLTGKLGDVMKESARAAFSLVRARQKKLQIPEKFFEDHEIHLHVPAGAVPKDGPSAGITMATAIASAAANIPVRKDVAMTGEITLSGLVLPIGGVKEKVLAAHRAGIQRFLLPSRNKKDLDDVDKQVLDELQFTFVDNLDDVLEVSLLKSNRKKSGEK